MKKLFLFIIVLALTLTGAFVLPTFAFDDDALDGNAAYIEGANSNSADFGKYPLGHGLMGGHY